MSPSSADELVRFQWTCGVAARLIVANSRFGAGDSGVDLSPELAQVGQQIAR
jgi:hypothetical protein